MTGSSIQVEKNYVKDGPKAHAAPIDGRRRRDIVHVANK